LILHEVTAIGLLVPFYYFFQWSDGASTTMLGGPMVAGIASLKLPTFLPWIGGKRVETLIEEWIDEGTAEVARFGIKYGALGFSTLTNLPFAKKEAELAVNAERDKHRANEKSHSSGVADLGANIKGHIFGAIGQVKTKSVMNAVAAYLTVKALFIPRIAVSVAMTPFFARRVLEPSWGAVAKIFRSKKSSKVT